MTNLLLLGDFIGFNPTFRETIFNCLFADAIEPRSTAESHRLLNESSMYVVRKIWRACHCTLVQWHVLAAQYRIRQIVIN